MDHGEGRVDFIIIISWGWGGGGGGGKLSCLEGKLPLRHPPSPPDETLMYYIYSYHFLRPQHVPIMCACSVIICDSASVMRRDNFA